MMSCAHGELSVVLDAIGSVIAKEKCVFPN